MSHRYRATGHWEGSTAGGYDAYDRAHEVTLPPAEQVLSVSADQAFGGEARLANPESLLLGAAVSCQLLSFLAVAARSRVEVIAYDDDAEALMATTPLRIAEIRLRPRIVVRAPATAERVGHLCEVAHRQCYVANSLTSSITVEPEVTVVPGRGSP